MLGLNLWDGRAYCTLFTPPPPSPPQKKFCITILSNFSWVLQSSQEKSKTMVKTMVNGQWSCLAAVGCFHDLLIMIEESACG